MKIMTCNAKHAYHQSCLSEIIKGECPLCNTWVEDAKGAERIIRFLSLT